MLNLDKWNGAHSQLKKSALAVIISISVVLSGMFVWQNQLLFQVQASPDLPPMTLTVVGSDGNQVILNETDIGNLESYRAYGGYKNSLGILKGLGNYTGVPINTFCNMVGGIQSGYCVRIVASDSYSKDMSYEELNGNLVTFDNVTGKVVLHNQTLTPILAYYYNDLNLSSSDGPLRVAIVGPEGLCTNSTFWVKQVVRLELYPNLQPMNLTVVALNGTELTLNETTISNLPALRAVGASRNQLGIVKNLGNYTGPSLNTFCNLAGGLSNDNALRVTAVDNYTKTFSYEEVNGAFATYDNVTGQPVQHNQSLTPILAYHFNDANLSLSDGPLRTVIIGPEGLATSSSYWVKQVVKLEIRYRDDVAITEVSPSKTAVGQNFTCNVNVTAENQGDYDETFNVTVYANETAIGTQTVALLAGNFTTITFTWNTSGFVYGNYTLTAYASPVPGETNTTNNNLTYDLIAVTIPGDISGDFKVGPYDFALLAAAYGSTPDEPAWNPAADINSDGKVGPADFAQLSAHYGQNYP
jgi:hypothetical protein